jgi:Family of unknown function (DUF695)
MTAEQANEQPAGSWMLGEAAGPPRLMCRWLQTGPVPDKARPVRITVGVACEHVTDDEMPAEEEYDYLAAVEEVLTNQLARLGAQLLLVVTSRGARDWVAYADSADWLSSWAPAFADRYLNPRPNDISAVLDPNWNTYLKFASLGLS